MKPTQRDGSGNWGDEGNPLKVAGGQGRPSEGVILVGKELEVEASLATELWEPLLGGSKVIIENLKRVTAEHAPAQVTHHRGAGPGGDEGAFQFRGHSKCKGPK